jgi:Leucine-rich repeat (LRR) protein
MDNAIGNKGAYVLSQAATLSGLKSLNLEKTEITPTGVFALAQSKNLNELEDLNLGKNFIEDTGVRIIAETFSQLKRLCLWDVDMSDAGVSALAQSSLSKLAELRLNGNEIGVSGLKALEASKNFKALKKLDLRRNKINPDGLFLLTQSKKFKALEELRF